MNKNAAKIALLCITIIIFSGVCTAVTYSDADGDGICEVGEVITFIGDDSYVDEEANEYPFNNWSWDFESDGIIDAYGKEVNHTYNEKGNYVITVYELGEVNIKSKVEIKIQIPYMEKRDPTFEEVLQKGSFQAYL